MELSAKLVATTTTAAMVFIERHLGDARPASTGPIDGFPRENSQAIRFSLQAAARARFPFRLPLGARQSCARCGTTGAMLHVFSAGPRFSRATRRVAFLLVATMALAARAADVRVYVQFVPGQKAAAAAALAQAGARSHHEFDELNAVALT